MARAFVVGNGAMVAAGDRFGALHEIYAPHFAPEHQLLRRPARLGLSVEGSFRWLDEVFEASIARGDGVPIADLSLRGSDPPLEIWIETFIDSRLPILVRRVEVTNRDDRFRDLALAFHHDFRLSGGSREAASRDPATGGVVHHGGRRALLLNAIGPDGAGVPLVTIAGDRGAADSLLGVPIPLQAGASAMVTTWLAAARSVPEARKLDADARRLGVPGLLSRTRRYWSLWTSSGVRDEGDLPEEARDLYAQSLHALRLMQAPSGAFLSGLEAPPDESSPAEEMAPAAPEERWCRLREAAVAADALGRAGYGAAARRYFEFAAASARDAGELCAVLDADGAPAPAPEHVLRAADGIALHLWAAARHFDRERDTEFMGPIYESSLAPAAERLATATDPALGLPISTDPWDERWGAHASVAAAVRGGLRAASRLAALFGETARARAWVGAADQIARAVGHSLYDPERGRFLRSVILERGERAERNADSAEPSERRLDLTLDASLLWLGLLDDLEPEDPRVKATADAVRDALWIREGAGGLARSEADAATAFGNQGVGRASLLATLWLAQHGIRAARRLQDLEGARVLLLWTSARSEGAGLLPDRLDAETRVAPSLAATAAFVTTVLDYGDRSRLLARCDRCGEPAPARRARRAAMADLRTPLPPGVVADL
ncbi:MAG TPA: glycoside hydrolase family 15 protein [Candidatus Eisenbacteria bacterium]|nr:glycoside hydrolase family 15 protein [Candidatus Eisenbacteria bacterium]